MSNSITRVLRSAFYGVINTAHGELKAHGPWPHSSQGAQWRTRPCAAAAVKPRRRNANPSPAETQLLPGAGRKISVIEANHLTCNKLYQKVGMETNILGRNSVPCVLPVGISDRIQASAQQTRGILEPK